ncbi:11s globulin subunit beta [Phtheirospermum japonicum]|uniref:11s globulin subunit beta n=1 Tax=Phtheirospermum japonicum TaxID=374723 RepID=A0A830BE63_9LAMI|nr:11s globulin subunit beta [Phtheirospermum japonicum]
MAKLFLSLLSFLLLSSSIFAARQASWQQGQCQISRINAEEPSSRLQAEGGVSEFWDHNNDEFQCAGVSLHRHRIQPRGLMLPAYHNAPVLAYVVQGRGIFGVLISGCPETFESSQQSRESSQGERRESFRDRHQRIEQFKTGDIIAFPAGAAHWAYNSGDQELIVVALQDTSNNANQLDSNPRSFHLAGNPQQQQEQEHGGRQHEHGNVFRGFETETLAEAFGVDEETARSLQGHNDERGHIVTVQKGLQVISPPLTREEYGRRGEGDQPFNAAANGLEETICSAKVRQNIEKASRADIYNPRAGRLTTVNSLSLPILGLFQLSAARGVLYKNAIMSPHWFVNAHSIMYITRGESRMQIVNHRGQSVFDGQVREGQAVVVPQNFAVVKQAGEQGCEWVEFNTNDNAMMNTLSGRTSALRGMPVGVIAASYQISREEAERLKFSRSETLFFSGGERAERGRVASA